MVQLFGKEGTARAKSRVRSRRSFVGELRQKRKQLADLLRRRLPTVFANFKGLGVSDLIRFFFTVPTDQRVAILFRFAALAFLPTFVKPPTTQFRSRSGWSCRHRFCTPECPALKGLRFECHQRIDFLFKDRTHVDRDVGLERVRLLKT